MTRIHDVIHRYDAARAVAANGVPIFAVGDPPGAQLNAVVRRAPSVLGEDRGGVWNDLLQAANAVRWRRITQPQPNAYQPGLTPIVEEVLKQANRLRRYVSDEVLLDQLSAATKAVIETDSPLGTFLLESLGEAHAPGSVVVACNGSARAGLQSWLEKYGVKVLVPSEMRDVSPGIDQSYVVAPPVFVPASLVTAPVTHNVTFVVPAWFHNRTMQDSNLSAHAEGRMVVNGIVRNVGDVSDPPGEAPGDEEVVDAYFPRPNWGSRKSQDREPTNEEAEAWKVLLGGGMAIWLDDGERIRSLNPRQPEGDRVGYEPVASVVPGTYLVLREGATERGAMYEEALRGLGTRVESILVTQERWKSALQRRLDVLGPRRAVAELSKCGVRSARQIRAWTEPRLISPQRDADFVALLDWLDEPREPTHGNAMILRRALYKATTELRKELEDAVARADLRALERDGFLHLELQREGFRGMVVTRVLARSPFTEIVPRQLVRVLFGDRSAKWLE